MIANDTIVQASFTIITYDCKNIFIIQATEDVFLQNCLMLVGVVMEMSHRYLSKVD
jgi:hypothetical protein